MEESGFIVIAVVGCTVIPLFLNRYFEQKYYIGVLMTGPIIFNCVALLLALLANSNEMYEVPIVVFAVVVYILSCVYVAMKVKKMSCNAFEIFMAVVANALLPVGIVLIIIMVLATLYAASDGKKKKRK